RASIRAFRSAISLAITISSASALAQSRRNATEIPTSRPPVAWTPSATTFISPVLDPPHTSVCPPAPTSSANSRAGLVYRSSRSAAERKTQRFMSGQSSTLRADWLNVVVHFCDEFPGHSAPARSPTVRGEELPGFQRCVKAWSGRPRVTATVDLDEDD